MEQPQKQRRAILHRMLKARIRSLDLIIPRFGSLQPVRRDIAGAFPGQQFPRLTRAWDLTRQNWRDYMTRHHRLRKREHPHTRYGKRGNDWLGYLPYNSVVTRELLEPVCFPPFLFAGIWWDPHKERSYIPSESRNINKNWGVFREHYWMKQCASYLGPIQLNASVSSRGWLTKDGMAKSFRLDNPNTSG
ncbi:conserved hypothetical protein [Coccidioides posadasii str. Silveira]|uniref:Uncharacterized protein n=1 Tax=Coccidioides posadasii (strain RMSCC 757 / Silveira) TaxID=443226 RepID=E9DG72_COCPS|nr:conserved hypothetical protein [Coccidioides posadasii str. Silveira]